MCVRGHVYVCLGYRFCLFLRFFYWMLKLFRQSDTLCFSFFLNRQMHFVLLTYILGQRTHTNSKYMKPFFSHINDP